MNSNNSIVISAVVMALAFVGTRFLKVSIDSEEIEEEQDGLDEPS